MALNTKHLAEFTAGTVEKFAKVQDQLTGTGSVDSGNIQVTLAGDFVLKKVHIAPQVVAQYSTEQIGKLIVDAHAKARRNLEDQIYRTIQRFAQDQGVDIAGFEK